jgi:hypothetical protein
MTTDRDFDRLARAWLDLMPDEAPDRTVAAVLQAVETTPQVRRPIRWLTWRSSTMNRLPIALGAAAVVVVAGTFFFSRAGTPPTAGASASPPGSIAATASGASPSSSSLAAGGPIPSELRDRWMGDHRGIVAPNAGTTIIFEAAGLTVSQANDGAAVLLSSAASVVGSSIRLETTVASGGCNKGDVGTYGWTRSSTGRTLTITPERDDCATRSEAVAGQWWLMGCTSPDNYCLGTLDAGTYQSQFITPHLDPGASWTANFGALSYTVPDGWANSADWPDSFALMPAPEMALGEPDRTRHIGLTTQPTAMAQDQPCSDTVAPGVGRTVNNLVTWLRTVPGLITTAPTAITIDGHPAKWLDVRIDPTWKKTCPGETNPIVTFLNPGTAVSGNERERLILLDLGGGDVIATVVWARDQATFDAFVQEAMPIVQSFQFE